VPNRPLFSLFVLLGLCSVAQPAVGQALVPHTVQLDAARLEQQGLSLAQEAAQLAQFQQTPFALPRAKMATQLAPKTPEVWALLGSLHVQYASEVPKENRAKELDAGITALQKARSLDEKNVPVLFALGSAYFQKEQYTTAVEYLQKGLEIKPNVPGALFDLGNAYYMLRKFPEAISSYEKAVAQDKQFWPAINNIGLIRYEQKKDNDAIKLWRSAVEIDGKAAEPLLAIAVALYAKGDREQALKLGETAINLDARYADLTFLKDNLWGDRLLAATKKFLATPKMQATIAQTQSQPTPPQAAPQ
jgi:tetratricopeptide (TPR) repeat protein